MSTSPNLAVNDAQKRIAKLQQEQSKRTGRKKTAFSGASIPARNHVQEMQRQVRQKINTPSKVPKSTINIPMNKVNELKKQLNESKMREMKKLENALMTAKKRAEINERVNTVNELLETFHGDSHRNRAHAKTSKGEELNLPRDRVRAMKSWLTSFGHDQKAHASKWNTPSVTATGRGGAYIPRIGARNQPFEMENRRNAVDNSRIEVDNSDGKKVTELTGWLNEFGKKNQAHYEKGSARPSFQYTNTRTGSNKLLDDESSQQEYDEQVPIEEDEGVVQNTSYINDTIGSVDDLNISMMPGRNFANASVDDECDWEDDYKDLMMTVDIERIESKDSWDKESVISPRDLNDDTASVDEQQGSHPVVTMDENSEASRYDDENEEEEELDHFENVCEFNYEEEEDRVEAYVELNHLDQTDEIESVHQQDDALLEDSCDSSENPKISDDKELFFHCDDTFSRVSFEGQPVDAINKNNSIEVGYDSTSFRSGLVGEHIMNKNSSATDLSSSFCGNRITDTSTFLEHDGTNALKPIEFQQKKVQMKKKKSGISKFFSSMNCMNNMKTSKAAEEYTENYREEKKPEWDRLKSSKSLFLSPDSHAEENEGNNAYLPNRYNPTNHGIDDFSREMLLRGAGRQQVAGSPMSLASAFRRQLSPGSSCVSGFTDVEACVMKQKDDIGEHVKHLQSVYSSPVRKGFSQKQMYQF